LATVKVPSCPTMLVGYSGVSDCGEKGDVVVFIDGLLGVDDSSIKAVSVGDVDRGDEVKGHSAMIDTVGFFAEVGVFKSVDPSDVDSSSWFELVVFESGIDFWVLVDECPKTGRGHDGDDLLSQRVLILLEVL